jgi:3-deoxy-manno-octulosonate cytidylyltransferase (CMP-KDO synthetase)
MKVTAIIPARIYSTRLPEKPLALLAGKPLIQWVYQNVRQSRYISDVIVATDSEKIRKVVKDFGGRSEMTSSAHQSGTDRIAEVARRIDADVILNVQGDEPFITKDVIDTILRVMVKDNSILMSTAKTLVNNMDDFFNSAVVKVLCDDKDFALYFSRAPIPYFRDEFDAYKKNGKFDKAAQSYIYSNCYKHIGVYAYRWDFLMKYAKMKLTFLEKAERLEQLRAVENGVKIKVPTVVYGGFGIDTKEDLERAKKILKDRA